MLSIKEQLTVLYVTIADFFDNHPAMANWRESNNSKPEFTDAEVHTIAMMQQYFRTPTLKRTFLLVLANDTRAFPKGVLLQTMDGTSQAIEYSTWSDVE